MSLRNAQRDAYRLSRALGDVQAARRGRLAQRLVKRVYRRKLIGLFRRGGAW